MKSAFSGGGRRAGRHLESLEKLLAARRSRRKPFKNSLYHDEYFHGEQCACEEMLLRNQSFTKEDKKICGDYRRTACGAVPAKLEIRLAGPARL